MKKSKLIFVATLFILPIMLFVGCDDPKYYSITTTTSNGNIGSVSGGNATFMEGTQVNLVATPRKEDSNPFICWIKDYTEVVSFDAKTTITIDEKSQGNYTALFEESSPISMTYATISEVSYNGPDYFSIDYMIYNAPMNDTTNTKLFNGGRITQDGESRLMTSVFNMYEKSSPIGYIFTVDMQVTNLSGENITNSTFNFNIDSSLFDENTGFYTFVNDSITIKFEKVTRNTKFSL